MLWNRLGLLDLHEEAGTWVLGNARIVIASVCHVCLPCVCCSLQEEASYTGAAYDGASYSGASYSGDYGTWYWA